MANGTHLMSDFKATSRNIYPNFDNSTLLVLLFVDGPSF